MYKAHSEKQKEEIELNAIDNLQQVGVISKSSNKQCVKASCNNNQMSISFRKRNASCDSRILSFRCKKCHTYQSIFDGSFFSLMRKRLFDILLVIKCWSLQLTIAKSCDYMEIEKIPIDRTTIGNLINYNYNTIILNL